VNNFSQKYFPKIYDRNLASVKKNLASTSQNPPKSSRLVDVGTLMWCWMKN